MLQDRLEVSLDRMMGEEGASIALLKTVTTRLIDVRAGDRVHRAGDEVTSLYCVIEGWITSVNELSNGERQLLNFYVPYDIVGFEYLGQATAMSDLLASADSTLAVIPIPEFKSAINNSPRGAMPIASLLARKYGTLQTRLSVFANSNAVSKIAHFVHGLRTKQARNGVANPDVLHIPLTQQDIADALGLTNVTVSRQFKRLREIGCLDFQPGRIEVLDYERLMSLTEGLSATSSQVDQFD